MMMATLFPLPSSSSPPFISSANRQNPTSTSSHTHQILKRALSVTALRSPAPATDPLPPAIQAYWQWLSDEGVVSDKSPVRPAVVPEGLGLVAQRDIARNEVVLEVPKRLWINPETVAASEIGSVCGGLKPWVSVALFLIRERSEDELSEIQGTQLLSTTLGVKEYVHSEFLKVEEQVILPHRQFFPTPITLSDFMWAFGMLRSRAFSRLRGQNLVLIPLADLINHNPCIETEDYAWEIKGAGLFSRDLLFSLRNPVSVKRFEQVLIQYDIVKSNAELVLDYGFIESKSDRHKYTLTLEIPESDPFFGDKLDIAESNGLSVTAYFDIVLGSPLPQGMIQYLRLAVLGGTDAFLLESIFSKSVWGHLELPVSRANEELMCKLMQDCCKTALSGYHTTREEDEMLERGNLHPRLGMAVGIRAGEKKVLRQIDEIFKDRESTLNELEYYQERRLRDLGLAGEQGDIIFWEPK